MTSLSQRRSSLLEAVGGGARRASLVARTPSKTAPKRASPARTAIPVKPPVVKPKAAAAASRIPVTKAATTTPRGARTAADVPAPLSDLSWKFSSDSRPTSPDAASGKAPSGGRGKPPIRPKSSSLRRPGPAPGTAPAAAGAAPGAAPSTAARRDAVRKDPPASKPGPSAEDQAIHDLQELVRRQQEELEAYQHPDESAGAEPPPLASCSLVQRVAKAVDAEVVVEAGAYDGPLQVKTVRLEDQDTARDVLQDPRLAATRSRLNQRLQHLLDEDDGGAKAQAAVVDLSRPPDPRRRSIFLSEGPASLAVAAPKGDAADWEPQELAEPGEPWLARRQGQDADDLDDRGAVFEVSDAPRTAQLQGQPASGTDWSAMRVDAGLEAPASHKDLYHQEIRELLEKLNADEAVFPYGGVASDTVRAEPIYATANKLRKTKNAGTPPAEGGEGPRHGQGHDDVVRTSISPLKQKASDAAAGLAASPAAVHPQDAGLADLANMSPLSEDDGDLRQRGLSPGSDLSLGSSSSGSDNTSGDDGIGDECGRQLSPWTAARSRGRGPGRAADSCRDPGGPRGARDSRDRDLSMDSGIQGSSSSCELDILDSSASTTASSASDAHDDDADVGDLLADAPKRPAPIGGCERQPQKPAAPGDEAAVHPEGEAFKVVEELYVADAAVAPLDAAGAVAAPPAGPPPRSARVFTETHFDSAPNLGPPPLQPLLPLHAAMSRPPFSSAPVGLDSLATDRDVGLHRLQGLQGLQGLQAGRQGAGDEPPRTQQPPAALVAAGLAGISSVVSLPNVQQIAVEGSAFPPLPHSASASNLLGPQTLLSPPEPFRRPHFRDAAGPAGPAGPVARQSKRFSSADDVFRASLLRHSLPAKPPRTPSVRASLEEDLSSETYEASPATTFMPSAFPTTTTATASPRAPAHHVVVAIDFGTTYSGYAFCYTRDADCNIHMMRKWEGGDPGLYNEKAPTVLLLTPEGKFHSFGFLARDTFHDLHPDQAKRWLYFDKFKMALLSQTTLTRDTTLAAANGRHVPALTVLSLSLAHLRERALAELAAADQGDSELGFLGDESVRWVLTVPALWGPSATQLLREAAHMAGLASPDRPEALLIVLEPEAASLYCRQLRLHQLHQHQLHQHQLHQHQLDSSRDHSMASLVLDPHGHGVRTQYMVVDCGGGTVDITVHELSGQRATLRELHKASGGACGSLGVDREFERLLSAVFGADFMSHFRRKRPAAYVELLLSFEARKRSAEPDRDRDASLTIFPPFAFVEAYRKFRGKEVEHAVRKFGRPSEISWSSQGMLRLSPQLMADLFQPTLDQVCHQVDEVLRSPRLRTPPAAGAAAPAIQYLFLVGGFAQSLMLQHRVRSQFGSRVKVVVPQAVGLTTLRGAVLYGLDPELVASRRSKHTIGVGVLKRFQPGEHPQDKLVTLSDGSRWCCDVLDVLVVADQPLGPGEAVTRSYTPASARQTNIIIHIYSSTDTSPPKFVTDAGVTRCGTLRLSLGADQKSEEAVELATAEQQQASARTREIVARIEFGGTELAASAQDLASGRCVRTQLDFLSTAV